MGLHKPNAGSITVLGKKIEYLKPGPFKQWGVLFQGGALLSGLTVQENVELPIALHSDLSVETRRELAVLKIFMVGLDLTAAAKYPNELSGGMQKGPRWHVLCLWSPKSFFSMSPRRVSTLSRLHNSMSW